MALPFCGAVYAGVDKMMSAIALLVVGLVLLVIGGESLVRGAVKLAARLGVNPLVIGLVVVGFGTSAPELVASVEAALAGAPGIAWGNIVGSNIANSLLILGIAVVVAPLALARASSLRDPLIAFVAALGLAAIALSGQGAVWMGLVGIGGISVYVYAAYRHGKSADYTDEAAQLGPHTESLLRTILVTLFGLALLIGGGKALVTGAVSLAELLGMSQTVIGLTIVAIGTSAPELATSIIAARHRQMQVVFGNIVGSNIYNLLAIGGATMVIAPGPLPEAMIGRDIPIMLAAMLIPLVFAWFSWRLARWAGFALVLCYATYLAMLVFGQAS